MGNCGNNEGVNENEMNNYVKDNTSDLLKVDTDGNDIIKFKSGISPNLITNSNNLYGPTNDAKEKKQIRQKQLNNNEFSNLFYSTINEIGSLSDLNELESKYSYLTKKAEQNNLEFLSEYRLDKFSDEEYYYTDIVHLKDGSIYNGTWNEEMKKEGKGILIKPDGSKYCGEFKNDKIEGKGYYIDHKGNIYKGEFVDESACGKGEILHSEIKGYSYKGEFKNNKIHGYGVEIIPNGNIYRGYFFEGEKDGYGKVEFEDGSSYEGEFKNGQINGKGKYIWSDGKIYEGEFLNNKTNGKGKTTWVDGSYYEGEYKNDQRDGHGTHYIPEGNKYYVGFWFNSLLHGVATYKDNSCEYKAVWRYGKKIKQIV